MPGFSSNPQRIRFRMWRAGSPMMPKRPQVAIGAYDGGAHPRVRPKRPQCGSIEQRLKIPLERVCGMLVHGALPRVGQRTRSGQEDSRRGMLAPAFFPSRL